MLKIGIFGGSFNPPHMGHWLACQYVLAAHDIDEIWIVPVREHPFSKTLLDFWHRYEMCAIMCRLDSHLHAANFDHKFTIDLIEDVKKTHPHFEFSLIIGSDIYNNEWTKWKDYEKIQELVPIIVVYRSEHTLPNRIESDRESRHFGRVAIPNVSSSQIRTRLKNGLDVSGFMPKGIYKYIKHNKLEF